MPVVAATQTANWPTLDLAVGFGSGVSTQNPVWTSVVDRAVSFSCSRGRSYELDVNQPGMMSALLDNVDGRYTPPGPPGSLYAGLVKLMCPVRLQATWAGVTYPIWRGFVDRWPSTYSSGGVRSWTPLQAVDVLTVLALTKLKTILRQEMLVDQPSAYYPLDDAAGSRTAASLVPGITPAALQYVSFDLTSYNGLANFGAATATPGDPGTGLVFNPGLQPDNTPINGYVLVLNAGVSGNPLTLAAPGFTVDFRTITPVRAYDTGILQALYLTTNSYGPNMFYVGLVGGYFQAQLGYTDSTSGLTYISVNNRGLGINFADGKPHHVVASASISNTQIVLTLTVDGVKQTATFPASGAAGFTSGSRPLTVGTLASKAANPMTFLASVCAGTMTHQAIYPFVLSDARIAAHYQAGINLLAGELLSARANRLLGYLPAPVPSLIGASASSVGVEAFAGNTLLAELQALAKWENGNLYVNGSGQVTFAGRQARYGTPSRYTFGEAPGELPYTSLSYDFDTSYLYNEVMIGRTGGSTGYAADQPSIGQHGQRTLPLTFGTNSDLEVQDAAAYLLDRHRNPVERIPQLVIDPSSNPALWPAALGLEIGDRITVARRPFGAPMKTGDFHVEHIAHNTNAATGRWTVTFLLSPANLNNYWRLDDPVYGLLDVSTRLAY